MKETLATDYNDDHDDLSDSEGELGLMRYPVSGDSIRRRVSYCKLLQSDIVLIIYLLYNVFKNC